MTTIIDRLCEMRGGHSLQSYTSDQHGSGRQCYGPCCSSSRCWIYRMRRCYRRGYSRLREGYPQMTGLTKLKIMHALKTKHQRVQSITRQHRGAFLGIDSCIPPSGLQIFNIQGKFIVFSHTLREVTTSS